MRTLLTPLALVAACAGSAGSSDGTSDDGGPASTSSSGSSSAVDTTAAQPDLGSDACGADIEPADGVVITHRGALAGIALEEGGFAFLGVPFAAPPIGALRFAQPSEPACWSTIREAATHAPRCPQLADDQTTVIGDEDCLYVNVWTPAIDDTPRPVLVFVHGGGNTLGGTDDPLYDGHALAQAEDVVVVTVAYRLGALGFLADAAVQDADGIAGNWGLLDVIAALGWVHDEITAFGGDPDRVLVFGQSAGAVDVCALLGTPRAAGLFAAAIVQSGTCNQRGAAIYAQQTGTPFMAASGCGDDPDPAACLRALPFATIVTTAPTGYPSVAGLAQSWGPHVDGVVLPMSTLAAMQAGTHLDVPLVIGANAQETARDVPELTEAEYEALIASTFGPIADQVLAQYPPTDYASVRDAYVAVTSDVKFVCNARRAMRAAAGQRSGVYGYHLTYDGYTTITQDPVAFHGLELPYIFRTLADLGLPVGADDMQLMDTLGLAWSAMAADSAPDLGPTTWPRYDVGLDEVAILDTPTSVATGIRAAQCDFWDALVGAP